MNLSIKTRLVTLHTITTTLVVAFVLGLLFSISSNEIFSNVSQKLKTRVNESYEEITIIDGNIIFDADFVKIEDGIYLSAYNVGESDLLYGRIPYGFEGLEFKEDVIREVNTDNVNYYVYDMKVPLENGNEIMIRGITSIDEAKNEFDNTLRIALLLTPLLIILVAVLGYFLSKRALAPVDKITRTVKDIIAKKDLSKRVNLKKGSDEIYELAATFDELLDDVEESMQREKRFTDDVAHELRTPLSVAKMSLTEALRGDLDPEVKEELKVVQNKLDMMTKMTAQLLLLARADQGKIDLHKEKIAFSELSEMVALEFKELALNKGIELVYDIKEDLYVKGDETMLLRLYNNVLENALNYSKEGSTIRLSVDDKDEDIIFKIADEGIGISKDDLGKIFERFYRADKSRTLKGSGLGLSIVKWIADAHDIRIEVKSEPDKGSEFIFTIKKYEC